MSNYSTHDMRPPRRNAVSEIPFAGRIGGFQQEIADDEKNREILKNQPDAVCLYSLATLKLQRSASSILTNQDSPLLNPRRPPSIRLPRPRQLENGRDRRIGHLPPGVCARGRSVRTHHVTSIAHGDQSLRLSVEFRGLVIVHHDSSTGLGRSPES